MLRTVLSTSCVLVVLCVTGVVGERVYDTDPENLLDKSIRYIGEHPDILKVHNPHPELFHQSVPPPTTHDALCDGCLSAMTFIKSLILIGIKWETVRDDAVTICTVVVNSNDMHGDIVCPGVMDNYGPLVYKAIKESRKSSKKICIHMNWCDPYYVNMPRTRTKREADRNKDYLARIKGILDDIDLQGMDQKMSTISETVKELIPQNRGHPKPDQGQVKNNQGQTKVTVKKETPIKKHELRDLVSDLPKLSQLFNDLGLGETKISQKFSDFARFVSSPESWKHKLPLKKLLAQSKQLEKKLNEAMRNVESKDHIAPNARKMAQLIADAITRTSLRAKRDLRRVSSENALKVVQLADVHIEQQYLTGAAIDCGLPVCCRPESTGEGSAGRWGEGECNAPPATIRKLLKSAAAHNPEFVVFTGDNPPHVVWLETLEGQLNASRWSAREMADAFPTTRVYPNMGNHENFPLNLYYVPREETKALNQAWGAMYTGLAGFGQEQLATIHKAGYYTTLVKPGLRIVAYNSNYGGVGNFMNVLNYDRPEFVEMIDWLKQTLAAARNNSEKVFLTCHHEYGASEIVVAFDELLLPILVEYKDIIVWHPVGHVHRDEFRLNIDPTTGEPVGVNLLAQTMNTYPFINPGYRVYYFDPETFVPLDYDQYSIDIEAANSDPDNEDIVTLLYSAAEDYDLDDLSPTSMMDFYKRMMADDSLFQTYWSRRRGGVDIDGPCNDTCRVSQKCHIISPTFDVYRACMRAQSNNTMIQDGEDGRFGEYAKYHTGREGFDSVVADIFRYTSSAVPIYTSRANFFLAGFSIWFMKLRI